MKLAMILTLTGSASITAMTYVTASVSDQTARHKVDGRRTCLAGPPTCLSVPVIGVAEFRQQGTGTCKIYSSEQVLHHCKRKIPDDVQPSRQRLCDSWPRGVVRMRVRNSDGVIDYGSAVCVGEGRKAGEWTFLSCSHNLESGGTPELFIREQWIEATTLFADELPKKVQTGPGHYERVSAGSDRSVLVASYPDQLLYRPVAFNHGMGPVALNGFPSTMEPVTISGRSESHGDLLRAELEQPSQGGFSGGGVFNDRGELVGIWTSGFQGQGYGHAIADFVPIFRRLGWAPESWLHQTSRRRN